MRLEFKGIVRPLAAAALGGSCGCFLALFPVLRQPLSPPVIAFIPRTSGTDFTESMHRGAEAAAKSVGYRIYWNAPTREDDVDRQIVIAESAMHRGAKALILGPTNIWGVTTLVHSLVAQRIPVVFVQASPAEPTGTYLTSVTPDQSQFGELAAARIAHISGGTGQVAIVGIDHGIPETLSRALSFRRAISAYPGIEIVAQSPGAVQTLEAEQNTRELVSAYPQLRAIFAVSADATQGVMVALKDIDLRNSISLVGCDSDLFLTFDVDAGRLDSLVTADGYQIGYLAVKLAVAGANGHPLPPSQYVGAELLTREHLVLTNNR